MEAGINKIGSNNFEITVEQYPGSYGQQMAVVRCTVKTPMYEISDIGFASGDRNGAKKTADLLRAAREEAISNIRTLAALTNDNIQITGDCKSKEIEYNTFELSKNDVSSKNDGGGSKPISEKQMNLINAKCNRKGLDAEDVCRDKYKKSLSELKGSEANQLIKELL